MDMFPPIRHKGDGWPVLERILPDTLVPAEGGTPAILRRALTTSAIPPTHPARSSGRWRTNEYSLTSLQFAKAGDLLRPIVTLLWKPLGRQTNGWKPICTSGPRSEWLSRQRAWRNLSN